MLSETRPPLLGRITFGALAVGAALALTACGPLPLLPPAFTDDGETVSPDPVDAETPTVPVETETPVETPSGATGPEDTDVFSIFVGDCLNEMEEDEEESISEVPKIDCSEPHDYEVYHVGDLDETGTYPGFDQVAEMSGELCRTEFEGFVGRSYAGSALELTPLFPTDAGWAQGDREVLCLVYDQAGQSTGTLEDSGI